MPMCVYIRLLPRISSRHSSSFFSIFNCRSVYDNVRIDIQTAAAERPPVCLSVTLRYCVKAGGNAEITPDVSYCSKV